MNALTLSEAHALDVDDGLCAGVRYTDDAGQRRRKRCSESMGGSSRIRCHACQHEQESTQRRADAGESTSGWRAP